MKLARLYRQRRNWFLVNVKVGLRRRRNVAMVIKRVAT